MGTSSSKFKKYLQHGDEYAAMQVYQNSSELRKNLHPNFGYGDHHQHNTPIHYASRHGMKHLIRAFLSDLGILFITSYFTSRIFKRGLFHFLKFLLIIQYMHQPLRSS